MKVLRLVVLPLALACAPARAADAAPPKIDAAEMAALRAKAEQGNAIAQYNLGLAHLQGRAAGADPVEAFVWLTLASAAGSTGQPLEGVSESLTPPQREEALRRLEALRAAHPALRGGAAAPADPVRRLSEQLASASAQNRRLAAELDAARQQLEQHRADLAARDARIAELARAVAAPAPPPAARDQPAAPAPQAASRPDTEQRVAEDEAARRLARLDETEAKLAAALQAQAGGEKERAELSAQVAALSTRLAAANDAQAKADDDAKAAAATAKAEIEPLRARAAAAERAAEEARTELARAREALAARPPLVAPTRPAPNAGDADLLVVAPKTLPPSSATLRAAPHSTSPPTPRTHVIMAGDTLSAISRRYYGTANRWPEILAANRDVLRDERTLVTGRTLRIP